MNRPYLLRFFLTVSGLLAAPLSRAQDSPDSDVVMLPCDGKCATVTRDLKKISGAPLRAPSQGPSGDRVVINHYAEGLVELQYTIQADGHVADDIAVVRLLGPPEFAEATKRTVRTFIYEPAMVDGQPVAISHRLVASFGTPGENGARGFIVKGYDAAAELLKNGKLDEAHAQLTEMLNLPSLNFYERASVMYLLVLIAIQRQQYAEASSLSGLALSFGSVNFSDAGYRGMRRSNIVSLLGLGDLVGAAKSLDVYKKWVHFDPNDPLVNQVAETQKKLDALPSYGVNAAIPAAGEGDGFTMYLYRRYFTFTNINGKLDRLTTDCREQESESPISDKAEWSVPKNWSDCAIFVRGAPGTTFQIVQFPSPPSDRH
jgi:Gram-negative bacterial TonB protein C-terminal